jgi:hypothetical protein
MRWNERATISVPPEVREQLADYRDEHGHSSYAVAIVALLDASEGNDG